MKFPRPIPVAIIAGKIQAEIIGDDRLEATGINEIHQVESGDISFVDIEKYYKKALESAATIILIDKKTKCPKGKVLLVCKEPFQAFNDLVKAYRPIEPLTATIAPTADIHPEAVVETGAVIGNHVTIGKNAHIQANAVICDYSIIGENAIIQCGSIVGSDAFYYKKTEAGYVKWRSGGRVIVENDVEIGAGCTICKGVTGDTVIGAGSKLDCQIQIGHDVKIGKNCLIAAQVGIAGNTRIGDWVILYGQVGIAQNLTIGDRAIVGAKSGVSKDLEGGKTYFGYPAAEARTIYREMAALRHLPEFFANYYK